MSKARAVNALLIEMSMLPIGAPSIRMCATRLPPTSATAMLSGWPISFALASPAAITRRASSNDTDPTVFISFSLSRFLVRTVPATAVSVPTVRAVPALAHH
jgi:hypothetical protein